MANSLAITGVQNRMRKSNKPKLIFLLLSAAFITLPIVYAQDGGGSYDASEFAAKKFGDNPYTRADMREKYKNGRAKKEKMWAIPVEETGTRQEEKKAVGERKVFEEEEKGAPVHELTGDWVPGPIDLTSNGGFSIEPFNGSPVPYDLNGHVNVQHGKP